MKKDYIIKKIIKELILILKTEKEIFEFLKLKYIKPTNRPKIVKIE